MTTVRRNLLVLDQQVKEGLELRGSDPASESSGMCSVCPHSRETVNPPLR
jgi:hypothetical protein